MQRDRIEHVAAHQLEREVDVAGLDPEQRPDQRVVDEGVHAAQVPLTGAVEAVGAHQIDVVLVQQPQRPRQLEHVERQVRIGVEDDVATRVREARLERTTEPPVAGGARMAQPAGGSAHRP
jgi:hypothetical protein